NCPIFCIPEAVPDRGTLERAVDTECLGFSPEDAPVVVGTRQTVDQFFLTFQRPHPVQKPTRGSLECGPVLPPLVSGIREREDGEQPERDRSALWRSDNCVRHFSPSQSVGSFRRWSWSRWSWRWSWWPRGPHRCTQCRCLRRWCRRRTEPRRLRGCDDPSAGSANPPR